MANLPESESAASGVSERVFLEAIGGRIRAARTDRALTQKALGALAGVHDVHISRLEAGTLDTRISTLRKVANALDLHVSDLLQP
ncbi:helix-turn-helix domain-containing protein [Aeromicrobium sp. Sec7.5]|uniref:helix-turn-helix domain-containing protein n=1 Tax=Aeromicrobium sp. Sec7.5 TaxID=3121276 RepID=UPI003FA55949